MVDQELMAALAGIFLFDFFISFQHLMQGVKKVSLQCVIWAVASMYNSAPQNFFEEKDWFQLFCN